MPSESTTRRERLKLRARRALLCGVGVFCAVQLVISVCVERMPELRDPKFGYRMQVFRQRLAENPTRPLILVLGSSRTEAGLRPAMLVQDMVQTGPAPLLFNFGLPFQGMPAQAELGLDRLLREGIRPRHLYVEILPAALAQTAPIDRHLRVEQCNYDDLVFLKTYFGNPTRCYQRWLSSRITPAWGHRLCIVSRVYGDLLPMGARQDWYYRELDPYGWRSGGAEVTAEQHQQGRDLARAQYGRELAAFEISPEPDRALRRIAARCRQEGIPLTFFTMPEAPSFRDLHPAAAEQRIRAYFDKLSRECQVEIIDGRDWVATESVYRDGHHLLEAGAQRFTQRFREELLRPILANLEEGRDELVARRRASAWK